MRITVTINVQLRYKDDNKPFRQQKTYRNILKRFDDFSNESYSEWIENILKNEDKDFLLNKINFLIEIVISVESNSDSHSRSWILKPLDCYTINHLKYLGKDVENFVSASQKE